MGGILIQYEYSGDEQQWEETIGGFINQINRDADLKGRFRYSVFKTGGGNKRVHVGRWDSEDTLETLKQKDFFKAFTQSMQQLAGESLTSTRLQPALETG